MTGYYIGDKHKPLKLDYYISEGEEGCVYRSGSMVAKIYWDTLKDSGHPFLDLETTKKMSKLKSSHILLPRKPIYNTNDEFVGYTTKHINGFYGDRAFYYNYKKEEEVLNNMYLYKLILKIKKIYKETYYLSKNGILLSDINLNTNYIFNGEYWLIDPGCYTYSIAKPEIILKHNLYLLNLFFINYALRIHDKDNIIKVLKELNIRYTLPDYIKDKGSIFENTLEFTKKII